VAISLGESPHPGASIGYAVAHPSKPVVGLGIIRVDIQMVNRYILPTLLLIFLALLATACGAAATAPGGSSAGPPGTQSSIIPPQTSAPAPTQAPTPLPAIPEARLLFMEWPPTIRVGDSRRIHLSLQVDSEGRLTPTVSEAGNVSRGVPLHIPNLYDTHNVVVEARFDIAGVEVSPQGEVMEPMQPGETVNFYWSVKPTDVGTYQGTIWLHLHFIPLQGGADSRIALTAQPVEINAINFLGLGGAPARILGGVGVLLGSVLSLDNILSWVWGLLKKRGDSRTTRLKGDE
jgi:hypothetical protein